MTQLFRNRDAATAIAEKLKVFAQPQRLMILSSLLDTERNVGEIAEATGVAQPALSQQLAELRRADLVRTRKEVKQVWYALANDDVAMCVRHLEAMFAGSGPAPALHATAPPPPTRIAPIQPLRDSTRPDVPTGVAAFARIV